MDIRERPVTGGRMDHPMNPEAQEGDERKKTRKLRRLEILRFSTGDSFLHRLDPRTKLLAVLTVSIIALLFSSPMVMLLLFLSVLLLAITSGLVSKFLRALTLVLPLFVLVIVLDSLFSKASGGPVYLSFQVGFLHPEVTFAGMIFALSMGFRLLTLAGISFLFIMTTSHDNFVRSLRGLKFPPVLTFSLGYALQSTTSLTEDTRQIMDAQRSRGLELDRGTIIRNREKLVALFIPVTVSLLKRSKTTADAMQARGFRQSMPQTSYKAQVFCRQDLLMGLTLAVLVIFLMIVNWFFPVMR